MIHEILHKKVIKAYEKAVSQGKLGTVPQGPRHQVSIPKLEAHGDYSTNFAMVMAGALKTPPREIANILKEILAEDPLFKAVDVAGPGFLNFFISPDYWQEHLRKILGEGDLYGRTQKGLGKRVLVEYVSANPTGPLHVGHGRGAAIGDSLARILDAAGFSVETEYYINDAGNQMDTLGKSVYLRYQELLGREVDFPKECYQGDYIRDIARKVLKKEGERFLDLPLSACLSYFTGIAVETISQGIRKDLEDFDCRFDHWFSERTLHDSGLVDDTIKALSSMGHIYEKAGALWFRSSAFGDEKDRVVKRSNGATTYFAADIAYHREKLKRGFHYLVDIWGADHHGYVPRVKAAIKALNHDPEGLKVILVQLVNLLEGGKLKAMSTRAGEFVTLREVLDVVGKDAARFIFLTRRSDSHLDFDLELARKKDQENPVYYVQYAHARLSSVFKKAAEKGISINMVREGAKVRLLGLKEELEILKRLEAFPKVIADSAFSFEPHNLSYYLTDLAACLHAYYNKHRFITDDEELTKARLYLCMVIKQVLKNGLALLGVDAPEEM